MGDFADFLRPAGMTVGHSGVRYPRRQKILISVEVEWYGTTGNWK